MTDQLDRLAEALEDRYRMQRELGRGGMATVYLARDVRHDRLVAIKVLTSDVSAAVGAVRFANEIKTTANLQHPHILPLFDSGEAGGFLYYVMPYVEGETLRDKLNREVQFGVDEAVGIATEVADALSYAHARGVIHRDIKPENILLESGHATLADFGIALALSNAGGDRLTQIGLPIGTPHYMSPEQATGDRALDGRADIFSLGCVLYEMLAGDRPFSGSNYQAVMAKIATATPTPLRSIRETVPPHVATAVEKALAKTPADRFESAEEFVEHLSPTSRQPLSAFRDRVIVGTLATIGALAILAASLGLFQRRADSGPAVVPLQRQVTFVGNVMEAGVSPRGGFLAYTQRGPEGVGLVVQDLESGSTIEVASSPGDLLRPQWSPDGREILVASFSSDGYAHLVYPRLGGDPYALPMMGGAVARWSADGRQTFSWSTDTRWLELFTIASASSAGIRSADTTAWLHELAQHPAGDDLALLQSSRDGPTHAIWRFRLDSAQRFEAEPRDSVRLIRPERYELLVTADANLFSMEWAPAGDALYYLRQDRNSSQLWKVETAAGQGARAQPELLVTGLEVTTRERAAPSLLSLTRDGSRLFYVKSRTFSNLWSVRPRGDAWEVEPFTTGTATNLRPSVSPDGEWVAYKSTVAERSNVFVAPSIGGPPRQLTHVDSVSGYPVWSPGGESLAFGLRRGSENRVATVNLSGPPRVKVYEATELSGNGTITWAPGSEILYQRPGVQNFHFLDPSTEAERPLLSADSAAVGYALQARYAFDGATVAVQLNRARGKAGVYVISLADGSSRRLTTQPFVEPIGWSEDGRTVFAISQDRRAVLAVPTDGGDPRVVATLPFDADLVGATHRGRWFVFTSSEATGDVWSIENFDPGR